MKKAAESNNKVVVEDLGGGVSRVRRWVTSIRGMRWEVSLIMGVIMIHKIPLKIVGIFSTSKITPLFEIFQSIVL